MNCILHVRIKDQQKGNSRYMSSIISGIGGWGHIPWDFLLSRVWFSKCDADKVTQVFPFFWTKDCQVLSLLDLHMQQKGCNFEVICSFQSCFLWSFRIRPDFCQTCLWTFKTWQMMKCSPYHLEQKVGWWNWLWWLTMTTSNQSYHRFFSSSMYPSSSLPPSGPCWWMNKYMSK